MSVYDADPFLTMLGVSFIWTAKLWDLNTAFVTAVPIGIMFSYLMLSLVAGSMRVHNEQAGDNLYYMGFLFTLSSLGVSLYLHSVTSAHAEYGLTHDRIRALMKANDPSFRDGFSDACTYFDAGALRPILEAASDTLTSTEASAVLGMREERVHDLLEAGIVIR